MALLIISLLLMGSAASWLIEFSFHPFCLTELFSVLFKCDESHAFNESQSSPTAKAVGSGDAPMSAEADIPQIYLYAPEYSEEVA